MKIDYDKDGDLEMQEVISGITLRAYQVRDLAVWEFGVNLDSDGWSTEMTGRGVFATLRNLAPAAMEMKRRLEANGVKRHTFADSERRRTRVWERYIPWMRHES